MRAKCSICRETKPLLTRGMCGPCYHRAYRLGTLPPKQLRLPTPKPEPKHKPSIPIQCPGCNRHFIMAASSHARGIRYCSLACRKAHRNVTLVCEQCGASFQRGRAYVDQGFGHFCSHHCHGLSKQNRIERACLRCGGTFSIVPTQAAKGRGKYCSRECLKSARTPIIPSKPRIGTHPWRRAVLTRDGHRCTRCGATERLHAHHIHPWAQHPALRYDLENGVTLCEQCHRLEHVSRFQNR